MTRTIEISSRLHARAETVWAHARTIEGVNAELWPICRMTVPKAFAGKTLEDAPLQHRAFRSWILLFGVLPIDYDDLVLTRITPCRGFREESTLLTQRVWIHDRSIEAAGEDCTVTDRVTFETRIGVLTPIFQLAFWVAFRNRHRQLRRRFRAAVTS